MVLFHWFSGSKELLHQIVDRGYYISEGPPSLYSSRIQEIIKQTPLTNLLTETDGPVRFWGQFKGEMTTPSFLPLVVKAVAQLKKREEIDVANQILQNFSDLFKISLV